MHESSQSKVNQATWRINSLHKALKSHHSCLLYEILMNTFWVSPPTPPRLVSRIERLIPWLSIKLWFDNNRCEVARIATYRWDKIKFKGPIYDCQKDKIKWLNQKEIQWLRYSSYEVHNHILFSFLKYKFTLFDIFVMTLNYMNFTLSHLS